MDIKDKLQEYIKNNYVNDNWLKKLFSIRNIVCDEVEDINTYTDENKEKNYEKDDCIEEHFSIRNVLCDEVEDIDTYIDENIENYTFKKLLFKYIDDRYLKDADVYNKVHIDRRLFNKIKNVKNYKPKKNNIILLGLSLELSIDELLKLLSTCSYTLSYSSYYDLIIRFCFINKIYNIKDVNELLAMYKCKQFNY